ncbi:MAG: tRNA (adenosine(37)-N6)-dimethylallyltransferase MiaA [Campylobacterota bacterium]|nr:tRNA (adenosine(37)-N6)-dimethylallyltransferase MiaA [Campylobacterota bacterium]
MKELAIIGPTASGKSDLAVKVAKKMDAYILSIDSLSIYKEIDIVSAKPTKEEQGGVRHFGIDVLNPDDYFSVDILIDIYTQVKKLCVEEKKNLVIVGGTSFYLKSLVDGLSTLPHVDTATVAKVKKKLQNLQVCYELLSQKDPAYMKNISNNDSYRIEKAMLIYEASAQTPSSWFKNNPPQPIIKELDIYNIDVKREVLRDRILKRTAKMLYSNLIDEVCYLEQKYTRLPHSMNSIGIVEVLEYLDGKVTQKEMLENISTHTAQLAKRQQTFNRTQFRGIISAPLDELEKLLV